MTGMQALGEIRTMLAAEVNPTTGASRCVETTRYQAATTTPGQGPGLDPQQKLL
jgi:hypothetical protein